MRNMLEAAIPLPMAGGKSLARIADGQRGGTPYLAGLLIAHVDGFAGRIADWIVRPRRELVHPAIDRPRVAGARLGDLKAEGRIRDDIDPGGRRVLSRLETRHVLSPAGGKASQAIEDFKLGWGQRGIGGRPGPGRPSHGCDGRGLRPKLARYLLGQ